MAAVALDVDPDRGATGRARELDPRQPERDQQDVLDAGVKRRGHLGEQPLGGLGVQRCRQMFGGGVGVGLGLRWGQGGRSGRHLPPGVGVFHHSRLVGVLGE